MTQTAITGDPLAMDVDANADVDAYANYADDNYVDERDMLEFDIDRILADALAVNAEERNAEDTAEFLRDSTLIAATESAAALCRQLTAIDDALRHAESNPAVYVGEAGASRADAATFARRAATAELAVALGVSENTINAHAATAETLRSSLPHTHAAFAEGRLSFPKVRIIIEQARALPQDDAGIVSFDEAMSVLGPTLTPGRLRGKARSLRERLHPEPPRERNQKAREARRVFTEAAADGMAWLTAYLPADVAWRAMARIDAAARHCARGNDETRTLEQLRADVTGDLLTGDGTASAVTAHVTVTVPVLALVRDGGATDPAILDGYGPIDNETARRLTATAPSLYRLFTDPIDGAVLNVGRASYRPPADLTRFVRSRDATCRFPGCSRPADRCDLDHTVAWNDGGTTSADNLAPLCRHHHRIKHNTGWQMRQVRGEGIRWRSPTGMVRGADPPPF